MKKALMLLCAVLFMPLGLPAHAQQQPQAPVSKLLAVIPIEGGYPEHVTVQDDLFAFFPTPESFRMLLGRFDQAAADDRVTAVLIKMRQAGLNPAQTAELTRKINMLQGKGKTVIAYMENATTAEYMLATHCQKSILHPAGLLMFNGFRMEMMFFKNLFDWAGIEVTATAAGKFKGAPEPFTRTGLSEANRKAMEGYLQSRFDNMLAHVAKGLGKTPEDIKKLVDGGPYLPADAVAKGLVSQTGNFSAYIDTQLEKKNFSHVDYNYGKRAKRDMENINVFTLFSELFKAPTPPQLKDPTLAVVFASGSLVDKTEGGLFPFAQNNNIVGPKLASLIKKLRLDPQIKGVILRVDSPGGSGLASDLIHRELAALAKSKLLVVSMGSMAASGGYYIAAPAKKIFAEPDTLTGSIGVFGMSMATRNMMEKLKIKTEVLEKGKNAGQFQALDPMNEAQKAWMQKYINTFYDRFLTIVAEGRNMKKEDVDKVAQGHIWTGTQALAHGLIDELGGLDAALTYAKATLGPVDVKHYPRKKTMAEVLQSGGMHLKEKMAAPALYHALPGWVQQAFGQYAGLLNTNGKPMVWMVAPVVWDIK